MKRRANVVRKTKETEISVSVTVEGEGRSDSKTGIRFLDHMLDSLSTHSLFDLSIAGKGDLTHHVVEDVALALGKAIGDALGDRSGIRRFGSALVPMDEALALVALDLVRRPFSSVDLKLERVLVEDAPREDIEHFFTSLATAMEATLHVSVLYGKNDHHKYEAAIKALALSLRQAVEPDPRRSAALPSSKGAM